MAIFRKGISWTAWAVGSLVAFFLGLAGATPPAWASAAKARGPGAPETAVEAVAPPAGRDLFREALDEELGRLRTGAGSPMQVAEDTNTELAPRKGGEAGKNYPKLDIRPRNALPKAAGEQPRQAMKEMPQASPQQALKYERGKVFPKVETETAVKGEVIPKVETERGKIFPKVETETAVKGEIIPKVETHLETPKATSPGVAPMDTIPGRVVKHPPRQAVIMTPTRDADVLQNEGGLAPRKSR